jgi:hypothetical protein
VVEGVFAEPTNRNGRTGLYGGNTVVLVGRESYGFEVTGELKHKASQTAISNQEVASGAKDRDGFPPLSGPFHNVAHFVLCPNSDQSVHWTAYFERRVTAHGFIKHHVVPEMLQQPISFSLVHRSIQAQEP